MPKLRTLAPRLRQIDTSTTRLPPKQVNPIYNTAEFQAWRAQVIARSSGRCEAIDHHGHRCSRATPDYRMYADHITELADGGLPFDLANGQCLCRSHHELKTLRHRYFRHRQVFDRGV